MAGYTWEGRRGGRITSEKQAPRRIGGREGKGKLFRVEGWTEGLERLKAAATGQ